jgi:hypothetical protein
MRLKSSRLKEHPQYAHDIARKLSAIDGVHRAEANPTTGSMTVHYRPSALDSLEFVLKIAAAFGLSSVDLDPEELQSWLRAFGVSSDGVGTLKQGIEGLWGTLNDAVGQMAGRKADMKTLFPMALFFLGVRSFFVSDVLTAPKWYEYFWFAFGAYFTLNKPETQDDAAS